MSTLAPGVTRITTGKGDRENAFLVEGEHGLTWSTSAGRRPQLPSAASSRSPATG
jgi:hypothetical protein